MIEMRRMIRRIVQIAEWIDFEKDRLGPMFDFSPTDCTTELRLVR